MDQQEQKASRVGGVRKERVRKSKQADASTAGPRDPLLLNGASDHVEASKRCRKVGLSKARATKKARTEGSDASTGGGEPDVKTVNVGVEEEKTGNIAAAALTDALMELDDMVYMLRVDAAPLVMQRAFRLACTKLEAHSDMMAGSVDPRIVDMGHRVRRFARLFAYMETRLERELTGDLCDAIGFRHRLREEFTERCKGTIWSVDNTLCDVLAGILPTHLNPKRAISIADNARTTYVRILEPEDIPDPDVEIHEEIQQSQPLLSV